MRMSAEQRLPAPAESIWAALNDIETLRRCIPGCERVERRDDGHLLAAVRAKVGPMSAAFTGTIALSDLDPPRSYTISGKGQAGAAGFAQGSARVRLLPDGAETVLRYDVEATVGGKLAQVGSRLIDAAARKFADDFFQRFATAVGTPTPSTVAEPLAAASPGGLQPAVWVPLLIAIVLLGLYLVSRL
jgi:carbon monoxide dehydrogenase subunit G